MPAGHKSKRVHNRCLVAIAGGAALVAGALVTAVPADAVPTLPAGCVATGGPNVSCTYTSGSNSFVVPDGIASPLSVTAIGGAGAPDSSNFAQGGLGAKVTGNLSEPPGTTLTIVVGGNASGSTGGANGGGAGGVGYAGAGQAGSNNGQGANGGGGGGASAVRLASADLLAAAGGGGGGAEGWDEGGGGAFQYAGGTGGNAGAAGGAGGQCVGTLGGQPGTSTAGGSGAAAECGQGFGTNGNNGTADAGGAGGSYQSGGGGGGGGGGVFGGGGGGAGVWGFTSKDVFSDSGDGGGGGGNLVPAGGTAATAASGAVPEVVISYVGLAITSPNPPTGGVGSAYNDQLTSSASSGTSYALSAGNLPPGLNLSDSGLISGTPKTAGTYPFTLTAAAGPLTATASFSMVIDAPSAGLSTASMTFGDEIVTLPSHAQTLTVTALGQASLAIGAVSLGGSNAGDFVIQADNCSSTTLPAGQSCSVSVSFAPQVVGSRSATLTVNDNAADSPQTVSLSGTGVQPPVGTMSATPPSGQVGTTITVTSDTPCPGNADKVALTLSDSSGSDVVSTAAVKLTNGGAWVGYLTAQPASPGSYAVGAECLASAKYDVQDYGFVPFNLSAASTAMSLNSDVNPAQWGAPVSLTASVSSPSGYVPSGSVKFTLGSTLLGTVPLNNGSATLTTSSLPVGSDAITAAFSGVGFASNSATLSETIAKAATTLVAAPASKTAKTFAATLTRTDDAAAISGHTVLFETKSFTGKWDIDCSTTTNSSGVASCVGTVPVYDKTFDTSYRAVFVTTPTLLGSIATASFK